MFVTTVYNQTSSKQIYTSNTVKKERDTAEAGSSDVQGDSKVVRNPK